MKLFWPPAKVFCSAAACLVKMPLVSFCWLIAKVMLQNLMPFLLKPQVQVQMTQFQRLDTSPASTTNAHESLAEMMTRIPTATQRAPRVFSLKPQCLLKECIKMPNAMFDTRTTLQALDLAPQAETRA